MVDKKGNKAQCILYLTIIVCRTTSVKQQYQTKHNSLFNKKKKEKFILQEVNSKNFQKNTIMKFVVSNSNIVAAFLAVSKYYCKTRKAFMRWRIY